ncbi:MAG: U32 family peptidase [Lachnospiraceae bacterium]|nr:U32 family peptidase [Lachnospiraceae bacterium]
MDYCRKPELLMPAGSPRVLETVLRYGADAVYLGSEALSLRAKARNFSDEELKEALALTHGLGKKLYLTVNIFAHNEDLPDAEKLFRMIDGWTDKPDAFIISDFGLIRMAKRLCQSVPLHISTQTNSTNYETFLFWYELGARRVVCARELSLSELAELRARLPQDLEIECFVHGAMCMSYSGRCLISNFLTGRDANRGSCTQPCRWEYYLCEETRPGQYMPVEETERGTYLYNSKDLCMIEYLPELIRTGAASLKVEGRMKTELYGATVARAYRMALDDLSESEALYREHLPRYRAEVQKCTTRSFCTGFYFGRPDASAQNYESSEYFKDYIYLGTVEKDERGLYLRQKNRFFCGDAVEAIRADGSDIPCRILSFETENGEIQESCPHPGQKLYLHSDAPLREHDILRKENKGEE